MAEEVVAASLENLERAHDEAVAASAPEETPAEVKGEVTKELEKEPETKETKLPKEELDDNRERSNLGRKVKILEEKLSKIDEISAKIDRIVIPRRESEVDDDAPIPMNAKELRDFVWKENQRIETVRVQEQQTYAKNYQAYEVELGPDLSEQEFMEVVQERIQNFNQRHSNNPQADAELNFHKAYAAVLKRKLGKGKENPLKGKKPDGPLGGITTSENAKRAAVPEKLDKDAADFAQRMGLSQEKISKYLGNG